MVKQKEIVSNTFVGINLLTLKQAIEKSTEESFYLHYQSQISLEVYGILKPFHTKGKEGFGFVPILIDGKMLVQ